MKLATQFNIKKIKTLENRTTLVKNTAWISQLGSGILLMGIPTILQLGPILLLRVVLFWLLFL